MDITFVGGPWHGTTRAFSPPLPASITAASSAIYLPWCDHPATAGVLAPALEHRPTYVQAGLMGPALLERVQDVLLHCPPGDGPHDPEGRCGLAA